MAALNLAMRERRKHHQNRKNSVPSTPSILQKWLQAIHTVAMTGHRARGPSARLPAHHSQEELERCDLVLRPTVSTTARPSTGRWPKRASPCTS